MLQVIEQTDEEKMAMYMKLSKKELAGMVIQRNKIIDLHIKPTVVTDQDFFKDPKTHTGTYKPPTDPKTLTISGDTLHTQTSSKFVC